MPSTTAKARLGARGAVAIARRPTLRRASAKAGWSVGKMMAKRQLRGQIQRIAPAGRTAGSIAVIYGPIAAEVLGLVDPPKRSRRAPVFAAGAATGAAAALILTWRLQSA